jgi:hypothetical protein
MKAIGFRAEPKQVHWVAVERDADGEQGAVKAAGKLPAPVSYDEASALDWYRNKVRTLIDEFEPDRVAVRYPEPSARQSKPTSTHRRVRIEGVILEAAHSKGKKVVTGPWATWSSLLGTKSAKHYLSQDDEVRGTDIRSLKDDYKKEAFLAALGALLSRDE